MSLLRAALPGLVLVVPGCVAPPAPPTPPTAAAAPTEPLAPSPRLVVGRVIALDAARGFAWVELAPDAPRPALATGTLLGVRRPDLTPAATLHTSGHVRGRTLGTRVASGTPRPGDEVVWEAPAEPQ
ncbi:MAG: hypothetical protein FJ397_02575 [Verrucomicrobia bacterium]|nr:hypothetical protein [Verrucomicrobiota bacterium]